MEKKLFEGKTYNFMTMPTFTAGGMGTTFMFKTNLKDGSWTYGDPGADTNFWIKDLNEEFQNPENIYKALEYVDEMPDTKLKTFVMEVISSMKGKTGGFEFSKLIGFMCEIGCWKNKKIRQKQLYDKDFYWYVRNCVNQYGLRK